MYGLLMLMRTIPAGSQEMAERYYEVHRVWPSAMVGPGQVLQRVNRRKRNPFAAAYWQKRASAEARKAPAQAYRALVAARTAARRDEASRQATA